MKELIFNLHHLHLTLTANKKNIFVNIYKIIVKIVQCLEYNQCSVSLKKESIIHSERLASVCVSLSGITSVDINGFSVYQISF